jgi:serine/threonine protein kinase
MTRRGWSILVSYLKRKFTYDSNRVADINPSNVMMTINDISLLENFEKEEAETPSPSIVIDEVHTICGSRKFGRPTDGLWGQFTLCDFGETRIGKVHKGLIQPERYRAPEVLFGMEWDSIVDVWNVANLVCSSSTKICTSTLLICAA